MLISATKHHVARDSHGVGLPRRLSFAATIASTVAGASRWILVSWLLTVCVSSVRADGTLDSVLARLASGEPTRIVGFGDSITGTYYHSGGLRGWFELTGVALERHFPKARVDLVNAGISGNTTKVGLARIDRDVVSKQPHLVVVMFGMNDVVATPLDEFAANTRAIVEKCRGVGAAVVLCTPNTVVDNPARSIAKLAALSQRVRDLARELGVEVADCFADTEALRTGDDAAWRVTLSDAIHPNLHGHAHMAETVARTIIGKPVSLEYVAPHRPALERTFARLAKGEPVHVVAMPPWDEWAAASLRALSSPDKVRVTTWPTEGKSAAEIVAWGDGVRNLAPDLVIAGLSTREWTGDLSRDVFPLEAVLNRAFPFGGREWDVVPVAGGVLPDEPTASPAARRLTETICAGKDVRFLKRLPHDSRPPRELWDEWFAEQTHARLAAWPALPAKNGQVTLPAQPWRFRPGARTFEVRVHYPQGSLERVGAQTGVMLTLHNWGGEFCIGTADPQQLADRLNVVALCVNYLQSGPKDSIQGPEPYDFGYLQALDALRALWWLWHGLEEGGRSFDKGRVFVTGGSGGGNVSLMANKLAPRTFAAVIDLCGMKKLSRDIAFHLPGGSDLDARWRRAPDDPYHLSMDDADLRFVGHSGHLAIQKSLGSEATVWIVHGTEDTTCPYADAVELAANMKEAGLSVVPEWIDRGRLDGKVFTSAGHSLGNRTEIVFRVAGDRLAPESAAPLRREGRSDFELRDERVRYPTHGGEWVISYASGYPLGRFEPKDLVPEYSDRGRPGTVTDRFGVTRPVKTISDWSERRRHIVASFERVAGRLPGESWRVPLDVKTIEERVVGGLRYRKVSFQSDPFDRVPAWLISPQDALPSTEKRAAILCLHQTCAGGKDEPVGLAGAPNMHYGKELAERGYVVLAPDYPSFGEHKYDFSAHPEYASGTLKAVWDNLRGVDLLSSLDEVDAERIGVIGHSLGGHNAIFTALFEPRLKVVVSSCGYASLAKDDVPSWTGPVYMPRIAGEFGNDARRVPWDFAELTAALAPRPFHTAAAQGDADFDVAGVREAVEGAAAVYDLLGAKESLTADYPAGPHDFPTAARLRAYELLDRVLKRGTP
jgi:lysophospholipase L1-like esterase/dienelactone hydrolase